MDEKIEQLDEQIRQRLETLRRTLRPISHERAEELMKERTRHAPEPHADTDEKSRRQSDG